MTYLLVVLACVAVIALAVLAFSAIRVRRALESLHAVAKYVARVVLTQPKPAAKEPAYLGALLEFGEDGLPWRMSVSPRSPFYFPTEAVVKLDGVPVERCLEADRASGWVQCEDETGQALPRRFGRVEVSVG